MSGTLVRLSAKQYRYTIEQKYEVIKAIDPKHWVENQVWIAKAICDDGLTEDQALSHCIEIYKELGYEIIVF